MDKKRYALIRGGELRNKGAQAMSLITIAKLRRRFPELEPVLLSTIDVPPVGLEAGPLPSGLIGAVVPANGQMSSRAEECDA